MRGGGRRGAGRDFGGDGLEDFLDLGRMIGCFAPTKNVVEASDQMSETSADDETVLFMSKRRKA